MKKLTIIDTFGFFFRNYYALPYLKSKDGFPTGLLTGFVNFVTSIYKEHTTDYLLFALDSKGETFRHKIDANYKANRSSPPEDLTKQLPIAIDWIEKMGFKSIAIDNYEADDIIASVTKFAKKEGLFVQIVSHDKDLYQLIEDSKVVLYDPSKKKEIDEEGCIEKFGIKPSLIRDYLSIIGDSSDNIPGVKGIGPKGAKKLLDEFGSLEEILNNLNEIPNKRTQKQLFESKENAIMSKKLVSLEENLITSLDLNELTIPQNPLLNIKENLLEYGIRAALNKIEEKKELKVEFKAILLDTKEKLSKQLAKIKENQIVAFDTETTSLNPLTAKIVGFSFAYSENEGFYVPIAHNYLGVTEQLSLEEAKDALEELFKKAKIVGQNIKYDLAVIESNFNITNIKVHADTMIISWLLNPELSASIDNMAKRYFEHDMIKFKNMVKKGDNFSVVEIEDACKYASEDAWMTLKLYNALYQKLDKHLKEEAKILEFPFIQILLKMEREGISIDLDFFGNLKKTTQQNLTTLTKEIYELSGCEFNINSPKQLGEVLFERLALPTAKKTKTGYSTNEQVLQQIMQEHKVVPKLLEYRELHKLISTYIEPLIKYAKSSKDKRIHTSFFQTGTATGRLSSKNPNLQNIPVKTKLGREIRAGFVAKEGYTFVSADYSQIELRFLAHFSEDEALVNAFKNNLDIHLETATKIFGLHLAEEKRNIAKSINFGLLYGMGARKLAQTLDIQQKEAKEYIDSYFASFPTVKEYISTVHSKVQERGYIETILNRKRYFDFNSASEMQKAGFLRESLNSIFQGSSADLIKLSMLEFSKIEDEFAKMLLQIHDELIFEVKEEMATEFADKIKTIMENIDKRYNLSLKVPLKVGISIGKSWGELK